MEEKVFLAIKMILSHVQYKKMEACMFNEKLMLAKGLMALKTILIPAKYTFLSPHLVFWLSVFSGVDVNGKLRDSEESITDFITDMPIRRQK